MAKLLLRRLAGTALALLVASFLIFLALDITPGDAAQGLVGESASEEQLDALRREMGLDLPLLPRYARFLSDLVAHGDLGRSFISQRRVTDLLARSLPHTLSLALVTAGLALAAGMSIGVVAALRAGRWLDTAIMGVTALGLAVPTFWSGLLLMLLFSLRLNWLPVVGAGTPAHLILPAATLALPTAAVVARLTRSSLLEELLSDYVRTARAKGVAPRALLWRHILRNSLIPVVSLLGLQMGRLLGGAFIVETIFGWPGLGRLTVQAIFDRDQPVVLGAALTIAAMYLAVNLAADLLHGWMDPRVAREAI
jgi:peptide/nickel transport system permease protein